MSLFRGENVYPTYAQFTPVALQPVNATEGAMWYDINTKQFKDITGSSTGSLVGVVAKADALAQSANIATTTLYTVPANAGGMYRVIAYVVTTQAATTSSTTPQAVATWTDNDTGIGGIVSGFTPTFSNNLVGVNSASAGGVGQGSGIITINVKAGTVIQYSTSGYASVGGTPMQYAVHLKLEYLGV